MRIGLVYDTVSFAAAEPDDLGEVADSDQVVGLGEAVIGEAYPGLLIGGLMRHVARTPPSSWQRNAQWHDLVLFSLASGRQRL